MIKLRHAVQWDVLSLCASLLLSVTSQAQSSPEVPTFQITPSESKIAFHVKASVPIEGTFEKWDATLAFASADPSTGSLDVIILADSVNTGSKSKDKRVKGKDFFDVKEDPHITFHSTKIIQTGPHTFDVAGSFTIRGISKPETLSLSVDKNDDRSGRINGTMAVDRRDFGMNSNIPFVRIANRVKVTIDVKAKRVTGPALLSQVKR